MRKNILIIQGYNTTLVQYEENGELHAGFINHKKENNNGKSKR